LHYLVGEISQVYLVISKLLMIIQRRYEHVVVQFIYGLIKAALLAPGGAAVLVEEAEDTLLGLVALARQILERLLALHHLLAAYNATVLVLDKVGLCEATGGVLCRSVENLGLGASREFNHLIQWNAIILKGAEGAKT